MNKPIEVKEYQRLRRLGAKHCSTHAPVPGDDNLWTVCMLGFLKSDGSIPAREEPGHELLSIRVTNQADVSYFEELRRQYDRPLGTRDADAFAVEAERVFLTLDLCAFSLFPPAVQPAIMAEVLNLADEIVAREEHPTLERALHSGDGFILVFHTAHKPEPWPLRLAQALARGLDLRNNTRGHVHFRLAVSRGTVFLTRELDRKLDGFMNYIGPAITEGRRLLEGIPKNQTDVIYFDEGTYRAYYQHLRDFTFQRVGSVKDKHGVEHPAFELEYLR